MYEIKKDYSKDELFDEMGIRRLKDSYLRDDEKSPQDRFAYVAKSFGSNQEHAQRLYDYASRHWLSFATPILAYGKSSRGLPISCFLSYMDDSAEGLVDTLSEVNWLSMLGGGVGIGIGIRSEDEKSVGVMPHLKIYEASSLAYRQGKTRRGSYAAYLDIDHPNIIQFIEMRKPTGDQNMRCLELHHAVNISDKFMELIEKCMKDDSVDDVWELKDPGTNIVKDKISAKWLWEQLLEIRMRTGEPYFHFIDTSNRFLPEFQKEKGLKVHQSNICVTGDTLIKIKDGDEEEEISIHDYIEKWEFGFYNDPYVWSFDGNEWMWAKVDLAAKTALVDELIEIEYDGKVLKCTPEHRILTKNRGYVEAQNLLEDDEIVT